MNKREFEIFTQEIIPQALFHVDSTDIHKESGAKLEDIILVDLIQANPECLKYKSLKWFVENYL